MPARPFATEVVKKLQAAGHIAYFAGGWVRDFLMQHPSDDIDIATSASVLQVQALFPKTIPVGVAFGIVIVVQEGHHFEVASFRKEQGYIDGRRPSQITHACAQEDAQRRDFTINGMFFDPIQNQLYDFVGGQEDLRNQVIRAIGDPHERFLEDRLRMMRAVRYSTRFHFPIEPDTMQAILTHAQSLFPAVAMERVWQEFKKMSQFSHFDRGLVMLHRLGLLPTIFPQLKDLPIEIIQNRVGVLEHFPKSYPTAAALLELFPNSDLEALITLCEYLKLSRTEKELVQFLYRAKQLLSMPEAWLEQLESVEWAHFYAHPSAPLAEAIFAAHLPQEHRATVLRKHQTRRSALDSAIQRIQNKHPIVTASDLSQEGILPGKQMGQLLQEAERLSINQNLHDKYSVITLLKKSTLWNNTDHKK